MHVLLHGPSLKRAAARCTTPIAGHSCNFFASARTGALRVQQQSAQSIATARWNLGICATHVAAADVRARETPIPTGDRAFATAAVICTRPLSTS